MNLQFTQEELDFQKEVRDWIKENYPGTASLLGTKDVIEIRDELIKTNPNLINQISELRRQMFYELNIRAGYKKEESEEMAIEAFAGALEVIPRTLAENAGLDPVNTIIDLRKAHSEGLSAHGVNVYDGGVVDMAESKVFEPSRVVEQAVQSASETAVMILRIDDVISSKGGPAGDPADFDGFDM